MVDAHARLSCALNQSQCETFALGIRISKTFKDQWRSRAYLRPEAGFGLYAGTETAVRADLGVCFRDRKRGELGVQALRLQTASDCILCPAQTTVPWTSRCYSATAKSYMAWVDMGEATYCTAPLPLHQEWWGLAVCEDQCSYASTQLRNRPLPPPPPPPCHKPKTKLTWLGWEIMLRPPWSLALELMHIIINYKL